MGRFEILRARTRNRSGCCRKPQTGTARLVTKMVINNVFWKGLQNTKLYRDQTLILLIEPFWIHKYPKPYYYIGGNLCRQSQSCTSTQEARSKITNRSLMSRQSKYENPNSLRFSAYASLPYSKSEIGICLVLPTINYEYIGIISILNSRPEYYYGTEFTYRQ